MKRNLLFWIAFLALIFTPLLTNAQDEYGSVLKEGFEDGFPQGWTQENLVGDINWVVEDGGTYPKGAFIGNKRLVFRNTTNVTTKSKTRLVSPIFDISKLYQPILVFAHAQDRWNVDFDTLRVYYRTSPDKQWTELKVYDKYEYAWNVDTLRLNGGTKNFQVAFEATDNLGRGVVLDNIEVRSTPNCMDPYDIIFSEISNDSVKLSWLGAFDAESFTIKVSTEEFPLESIDEVASSKFVFNRDFSGGWDCAITGLKPGTNYFCYIKSNCYSEQSNWVMGKFKTSNMLELPYFENFNLPQTPGFLSYLETWYYNSDGNIRTPYLNTNLTSNLGLYSCDNTFALSFTGETNNQAVTSTALIPSMSWTYTATPMINVEDMSKVQLSFYAMRYNTGSERTSIIVGVMVDPEDKSTFVAVDTVDIVRICDYEECFVSFDNYKGEGKYIAFMSEFNETNLFSLDNLSIYIKPEVEKPVFDIILPKAEAMQLRFKNNYDKYEVIVSESMIEVNQLDTATGVVRQEIVNMAVIEGLEAGKEYFVYARSIKGTAKSEWSYYKRARVTYKLALYPTLFDFNITDGDTLGHAPNIGIYTPPSSGGLGGIGTGSLKDRLYLDKRLSFLTSVTQMPNCINISYNQQLYLHVPMNRDAWMAAIFPELPTPSNTDVTFTLSNFGDDVFTFYVGVMSDANDINTFQAIDTITAQNAREYYNYSLGRYNVTGNYFVLMISRADVDFDKVNSCAIDDLEFTLTPDCPNVRDIEWSSTPETPANVVVSWAADGVTSWNFRLADQEYSVDSLDNLANEFIVNDVVTTNSIQVKGLNFPKYTYYCWVQPVCNGVAGKWSRAKIIITECRVRETIPYVEDFENPNYSTSSNEKEFTVPCIHTMPISQSNNYYPYVAYGLGASGIKSMAFFKSPNWEGKNLYVALPQMAEDINKLQISFKWYTTISGQSVSIGVMESPYDTANIEIIADIKPKIYKEFVEYIVPLDSYRGKGEYIAIVTNQKYTAAGITYIDDIVVDYINSCRRIETFNTVEVSHDYAKLKWEMNSNKCRLVLATERLSAEELNAAVVNDSNIIYVSTLEADSILFNNLADNTLYVAYVQSLCGEESSAWSNPLIFRTTCAELDSYHMGVETFETYGAGSTIHPACYVVGNIQDESNANYVPHCYSMYGVDGSRSMRIASTTSANGAYAITPNIKVDKISRLRMKFSGSTGVASKATDSYARSLIVGVITDPSDLGTFEPIDTFSFNEVMRDYEVYFNDYRYDYNGDQGRRVMFLSQFDKTNEVYIDNIVFDTIPECYARVDITKVADSYVSLKFKSSAISYEVKYSKAPYTLEELNSTSVPALTFTTKEATITGLDYNTMYYIYVRSMCSEGVYSDWAAVEIVFTNCYEKIVLPFFDDFEVNPKAASATPPMCWNTYYSASSSNYPTVHKTAYSGTKGVQLYATSSYSSYLVSAPVEVESLSKCMTTFYAQPSTKNANVCVIVGAVSNLDSISETFEPIDTIILKMATLAWEKQQVSLSSYKGTAKHIAFMTTYAINKANRSMYIDDISIELEPSCFTPENFLLTSRTDKSFTVSFTHEGALSYELCAVKKGQDFETNGISVFDNTTTVTISNLEANTEYELRVRTICGENDKSEWAEVGTYMTRNVMISEFPHMITFDDVADNAKWNFAQAGETNQWYIGVDNAKAATDNATTRGNVLYISHDNGATANYQPVVSNSWAYRTVYLTPGVYSISYDWTCVGESTKDYFRVCLAPSKYLYAAGSTVINDINGAASYAMSTNPGGQADDWFDLSKQYSTTDSRNNGVDSTLALDQQWMSQTNYVVITPENEGAYDLLFYWQNDAAGVSYTVRGAVVDNVSIVREACCQPYKLAAEAIAYDQAEATWQPIVDQKASYVVMFLSENVDPSVATQDQIGYTATVDTTFAAATGLVGSTTYYTYVKAQCDKDNSSIWHGPVTFTTPCSPQPIDSIYSFDDADVLTLPKYETGTANNSSYYRADCFIHNHETLDFINTNATYIPYVLKNSSTSQTSRSGDYAVRLYYNQLKNAGGYFVMPLVEGNLEDLQLTFWMRPIAHNKSTKKLTVTYNGTTYARRITVGTMTDPEDFSTFVELKKFEYNHPAGSLKSTDLITDDVNGNDFWMQCIMPLAGAKGKYIVFLNEGYGYTSNNMYIDDIEVTEVKCVAPTNIVCSSVTSTSTIVNASSVEANHHVVEVSKVADFTTLVKCDTVNTFPMRLQGLEANTHYYIRAKSFCSAAEESSYSAIAEVTTAYDVCYKEEFENMSYCPDDWKRASAPTIADYMNSNHNFSYYEGTIKSGWASSEAMFDNGKFSDRHIAVNLYAVSKYWLFSPTIDLSGSDNYVLTFDLSVTDQDSNLPITYEDAWDTDDRLAVVIAENGGNIWRSQNITIYDAATLHAVPHTGQQFSIDLSKYAGQVIKVAFCAESTAKNASTTVHLDNVRVNTYEIEKQNIAWCAMTDYRDENFNIEYENITAENNVFTTMVANDEGDVLHELSLNVTPNYLITTDVSICEGDVYTWKGTTFTKSGVYKQKYVDSNGCDSIHVLNLNVVPLKETVVLDTICYGSSYIWNGVEYNRTGTYADTLVSKATGCDSICILALYVKQAITNEVYVNICNNGSYQFGGLTITESGTFVETFVTPAGCDSIVTLHTTLLPDLRQTIKAHIEEGETYNENGFVGLSVAGTYTLPLTSVDGCDSTVTLILTVGSTGVAVDNLMSREIVLAPNPVNATQTLFVNAEFTADEMNGLVVEVFNAIGQRVYADKPAIYPIEIKGLTQQGVYMVRITAGNGNVYKGKVIVE